MVGSKVPLTLQEKNIIIGLLNVNTNRATLDIEHGREIEQVKRLLKMIDINNSLRDKIINHVNDYEPILVCNSKTAKESQEK